MKKTTKNTIAILAAAALLCAGGCANNPVQETTADTQAYAAESSETTTDTAETEQTSSDTQPSETVSEVTSETAPEEDNSGKTLLYSAGNGNDFYLEDAVSSDEYTVTFDYAYVSAASGVYDDSFISPGAFDASNYSYNGEMSIDGAGALTKIKAGDEFCGYKIRSALTKLMLNEYDGETQAYLFSQEIVVGGEYALSILSGGARDSVGKEIVISDKYTLSGLLLHYCGDEYGVSAGDIRFVPDASAKGLSLPYVPYSFYTSIFDNFGGTLGVYTDSPFFSLGNIISGELTGSSLDESGNWVMDKMDENALNELYSIFGTDKENRAVRANVTFSEMQILWSDQFEMNRSMMKPTDISVIE